MEQNNDKDGIIWPAQIAPYHVLIVPVNIKDDAIREKAFSVYEELTKAGLEVLLDDRDERPGVKFKDADLYGFPLRITIGKKTLDKGQIEVRTRKTGETVLLPADDFTGTVRDMLEALQK